MEWWWSRVRLSRSAPVTGYGENHQKQVILHLLQYNPSRRFEGENVCCVLKMYYSCLTTQRQIGPGIFSWDFAADFARLQFPVQSLQSACCQVKAPRINKHKNTNQVRKPPWFHPFATRLLCLSSQHGASSAVKIVAAAEKCCKNACPVHCIVQCPHTAARRSCQCVSYEVRVIDLWTGLEQSTQNNVTWFFSLISFVGAGI